MHALRIIALSLIAAIGYGVLHDQVTVRISLEYFTIGHPPLLPTESPTLLALGWGVVATWWVGLPLGLALAAAARLGRRPKLSAADLRRPIGLLLLTMGVSAAIAGAIGALLAANGKVWLVSPMFEAVPTDRHVRFLTALWMHSASYAIGILGGVALVAWTWRRRKGVVHVVPTSAENLVRTEWTRS
jgi:hypothetical protein